MLANNDVLLANNDVLLANNDVLLNDKQIMHCVPVRVAPVYDIHVTLMIFTSN